MIPERADAVGDGVPGGLPEPWPPAGCPPLAWPGALDRAGRLAWYRAVIAAYAALWDGHSSQAHLAPVAAPDLEALEARLGCALPPALRDYHHELGALSLAETLCSALPGDTPIQPLAAAFPGLADIGGMTADDRALAAELVVFSDTLGHGNMACFHRRTGEVHYFDHDTAPALTRFFAAPDDYLDALMVRCLGEIHEDDDGAEALLAARFGPALVAKWLY